MVPAEFLAALHDVDVIVVPTTSYPAHAIGGTSAQPDTHSLTRPISLTGLPALAIPCGFAQAGLPISMQLIGRVWEEATVLRLGHAYEQAAGWYQQRTPLSAGPMPPSPSAHAAEPPAIDAQWVLDCARLTGLTFVTEAYAAPIAASIGPQKTQLAAARQCLGAAVEPPVRPVLG